MGRYVRSCPQSQSLFHEDTRQFVFLGEMVSETLRQFCCSSGARQLGPPLPGLACGFSQDRHGDCLGYESVLEG